MSVSHVFTRKKCYNFQKQIIVLTFLFTCFHIKVKRIEHTGVRKPWCQHEVKYTSISADFCTYHN